MIFKALLMLLIIISILILCIVTYLSIFCGGMGPQSDKDNR
jgi:hypothetical protein